MGQQGDTTEVELEAFNPDEEIVKAKAPVVVVLFGDERSPETIVKTAAALQDVRKVQVVLIREVPDSIFLDGTYSTDPFVESLHRRLANLSQEEDYIEIDFREVISHDAIRSVRGLADQEGCEWLIAEWSGRAKRSILRNPLAWSLNKIDCNRALFRDAGVNDIRKILVYAEPGPHDALVASTADHLGEIFDAELTFVRFVPDNALLTDVQAQADYVDQLKRLCSRAVTPLIARGPREVSTMAKVTADYDLLIMGAPPEGYIRSMVLKTDTDKLTEKAACSVLRLRTPYARTHETISEKTDNGTHRPFDLSESLDIECIMARLEDTKKDALFGHISQCFATTLPDLKPKEILTALQERELLQNTAVGHGLGLPHGTLPGIKGIKLGIFTTAEPIEYQAPDGSPVDVFFTTISSIDNREGHLELLSWLARLVVYTDVLDRMRAATSPEEIMAGFTKCLEEMQNKNIG